MIWPLIEQTNSDVLKVSFFLNAVLNFFNFAISPEKTHLCRLRDGAKATWEEFTSLSQLYTLILKGFPTKTKELLMQSRAFNLYTRDYHKLDFNWLPQIDIAMYLIELDDGIYNLRTCKFIPHHEIKDMGLRSCVNFWSIKFENLIWPTHGLEVFTRLRFEQEYNIKLTPDWDVVAQFASDYSNIFHEKIRNDRVILVIGPPGCGKSTLGDHHLASLFCLLGCHLMGIISSDKGEYQFTPLRGKEIGIFNEFNEDDVNTAIFNLLLEGAPTAIPQKFKETLIINNSGDPILKLILLSNHPIPHDPAIRRRLQTYFLHHPKKERTRQDEII